MSPRGAARVFVVGSNHRSSTALLRDRLFVDETMLPRALDRLRAAGVEQALILRPATGRDPGGWRFGGACGGRRARRIRLDRECRGRGDRRANLYAVRRRRAAPYLRCCRLARQPGHRRTPGAGPGKRASHRISTQCGMVGPELDAILQAAYGVAKRVRSARRTSRGGRSPSPSVAAQIAHDLHGDLADCRALIIGLGDIGELIQEQLRLARACAQHPHRADAAHRSGGAPRRHAFRPVRRPCQCPGRRPISWCRPRGPDAGSSTGR